MNSPETGATTMTDRSDARSRIMARLRAAPGTEAPERPTWSPPSFPPSERVARFIGMLTSFHADVHEVTRSDWPDRLLTILANRGVASVLYAPDIPSGRTMAAAWAMAPGAPSLIPYDRPVEDLKTVLVHGVDAGVTTTLGGIAETGSLVLWPNADEPRLMSLLPPVHVALVEEDKIVDSLAGLMAQADWSSGMPTNAILISGPSKTADIEQTLAYGVHGPKELIVLVIKNA